LLGYLRDLQRRHATAVILVHHARKGAGNIRAGQALRGSSEFRRFQLPLPKNCGAERVTTMR
jgi:hypothetical protein